MYGDKILVNHQWDILEVLNWYLENKDNLRGEMPFLNPDNLCIAGIRALIYDKIDFDNLSTDIEVFEDYFSKHTFTLRGTDVNIFYIGVNNHLGEISFEERGKFYSYNFDMDTFIVDIETKMSILINSWYKSEFKTKEAMLKIMELQDGYKINLLK